MGDQSGLHSKSGARVGPSDDEITKIVQLRKRFRSGGEFAKADALRNQLLLRGIVICDSWCRNSSDPEANGREWMRLECRVKEIAGHTGCMKWNHKQRAFCASKRDATEMFCRDHLLSDSSLKGRLPCPLDPRHCIKPARAFAHTKICQDRSTYRRLIEAGRCIQCDSGRHETKGARRRGQ